MRILKALAAVLAGTLLLALPAVAMPRDPQDPDCETGGETAGDTTDPAGETNSGDATLDESGGAAGESGETTEGGATPEECAPEDDQAQQDNNQLQSTLEGLLGGLLGG